MPTSRRKFIRQTAAAAMGTGFTTMLPLDAIAQMRCRVSANDKINVGLIGCKGMGWSNLSTLLINVPEAECIALADVDQSVLDERAEKSIGMRHQVRSKTIQKRMLCSKQIIKMAGNCQRVNHFSTRPTKRLL